MAAETRAFSPPTVEFKSRLPRQVRLDVERLLAWLRSEASTRGIDVSRVRVSRWRSAEVPQNRETVVDVWIEASETDALALWTRAGDFLDDLPSASGEHNSAPLAVDVHWS